MKRPARSKVWPMPHSIYSYLLSASYSFSISLWRAIEGSKQFLFVTDIFAAYNSVCLLWRYSFGLMCVLDRSWAVDFKIYLYLLYYML